MIQAFFLKHPGKLHRKCRKCLKRPVNISLAEMKGKNKKIYKRGKSSDKKGNVKEKDN